MPVTDTEELAPIYRLLAVAKTDTGQASRVASFLLVGSPTNRPDEKVSRRPIQRIGRHTVR